MKSAFFSIWVHDLDPFLIQFTETLGVRYYGLAYVLGFLAAAWTLVQYARRGRSQLSEARVADFMIAMVLGVVLGGRIGYFLLYDFESVVARPVTLLRVWDGGMSFHGGLAGVVLAVAWYARAQRLPFLHLGDLACTVAPFGLLFGRIANFINGELWGKITDVSWAVIFPSSAPPGTPLELIPPRHPSQLYEAATEGLLLLVYLQLRFWKTDTAKVSPGQLSGEFFLGYAVMRIFCEHFREPDASLFWGISRGTFYSLFVIFAGIALIVVSRRRKT